MLSQLSTTNKSKQHLYLPLQTKKGFKSEKRSTTPTPSAIVPVAGLRSQKSVPYGLNLSSNCSINSRKTPTKNNLSNSLLGLNRTNSFIHKTPSKSGRTTPSAKSAKKLALTPSRNTNFDPLSKTREASDRYIACREACDFEYFETKSCSASFMASKSVPHSPNGRSDNDEDQLAYSQMISQALDINKDCASTSSTGGAMNKENSESTRVLAYKKGEAPKAVLGFSNHQKVLFSTRAAPSSSCQKSSRIIPKSAERILDAPSYADDFYLNLVDWGCPSLNLVCVALGNQVFLWNASTGNIEQLFELPENTPTYISSVRFAISACYCAIGLSNGEVKIFDVEAMRCLRTLHSHEQRVSTLAWNEAIISSGCASGQIHHSDVRIANHLQHTVQAHDGEIAGLQWSSNGRQLASGANDNHARVWVTGSLSNETPFFDITDHQAAIKALAWCPWQPSILATGGGTNDRHLRIYNVNSSSQMANVDTRSQVSGIVFSDAHKEILTAHGYPNNQICIYKYPSLKLVQELQGHESRVLNVVGSPCGEYVLSSSADETLRLWHCFGIDAKTKRAMENRQPNRGLQNSAMGLMNSIR